MIAYRSLATWRGEGTFGAWLSRIAVRLAIRSPGEAQAGHLARPGSPPRASIRSSSERYRSMGTTDAVGSRGHTLLRLERDAELRRGRRVPRRAVSRGGRAALLRGAIARGDRRGDRSAARHREDAPPSRPGPPAQGPRGGRPMTGHRPWGSPAGPFGSEELHDVPDLTPEDEALDLEIGRALERLAARDESFPPAAFSDRVMRAVSAEPRPAPAVAAAAAVRRRSLSATLASLRDAFRVSFGGARPFAARAQAFALVLLVVVALGGTTVGAASALGLLSGPAPSPSVPTVPSPSPSIDAAPSPSPSLVSPSPAPTPSISPSPTQTEDASARPTGSDDHGGGSGSGSGSGSGRARVGRAAAGRLARPTTRLVARTTTAARAAHGPAPAPARRARARAPAQDRARDPAATTARRAPARTPATTELRRVTGRQECPFRRPTRWHAGRSVDPSKGWTTKTSVDQALLVEAVELAGVVGHIKGRAAADVDLPRDDLAPRRRCRPPIRPPSS